MPGLRIKKSIYVVLGCLFFAAGVLGAFLPILPTTPFMLLALWAFSNSSERLHDYVFYHPRFGHAAREWRTHGAVALRVKVVAITVMTLSGIYIVFFSGAGLLMIAFSVILIAVGAGFLLTRPTLRDTARDPNS